MLVKVVVVDVVVAVALAAVTDLAAYVAAAPAVVRFVVDEEVK